MNHLRQPKTLYPILSALLALCGTVALCLGLLGTWIAALVGANVFTAAGTVCGTEVRTVRRKNPMARFSEDEEEELEAKVYRIPLVSVLLALLAALAVGIIYQSAVLGLLTLFTWGGLGYPLAIGILARTEFGLSLQTGLISATALTGIGGLLQIWISSPGNSFDPKYCFDMVRTKLLNLLTDGIRETEALLEGQSQFLPEAATIPALWGDLPPEEVAALWTDTFFSVTPALFAIGVLALLCGIWWLTKVALKRCSTVEVQYMGRIDTYRPGRALSLLYLVCFLANLLAPAGSALQIAGTNLVAVISAVLTFAGFSLVLYIINTRIPSAAARVILTIVAAVTGISSCGMSLLLFLGLLSSGRDLRGFFGGGTLQ